MGKNGEGRRGVEGKGTGLSLSLSSYIGVARIKNWGQKWTFIVLFISF